MAASVWTTARPVYDGDRGGGGEAITVYDGMGDYVPRYCGRTPRPAYPGDICYTPRGVPGARAPERPLRFAGRTVRCLDPRRDHCVVCERLGLSHPLAHMAVVMHSSCMRIRAITAATSSPSEVVSWTASSASRKRWDPPFETLERLPEVGPPPRHTIPPHQLQRSEGGGMAYPFPGLAHGVEQQEDRPTMAAWAAHVAAAELGAPSHELPIKEGKQAE